MHTWSAVGLMCLLAVGCAPAPPGPGPPGGERPRVLVQVHGIVAEEPSGRPLAGAVVSIDAYGEEVVADAEGLYRIRTDQRAMDRPTGVQAFVPGFLPDERRASLGCQSVVTGVGERAVCRVRIDFWLQPFVALPSPEGECTVSGRTVAGDDNAGVPAMVLVDGTGLGALADSSGNYSIPEVPAGVHRLSATLAGMVTQRRLVQVRCESSADAVTLGFQLTPLVIS